ncbi:hypothetical protein C1H46_041397 [Malus baccata]|uniref:Uncharacterized protein n=1 Tax=Malus baccata TaxID=106549 RepID=A0A540KFZ6_MALBA|nr:hypothetical protein C1H46_041397 [Malus baccata]
MTPMILTIQTPSKNSFSKIPSNSLPRRNLVAVGELALDAPSILIFVHLVLTVRYVWMILNYVWQRNYNNKVKHAGNVISPDRCNPSLPTSKAPAEQTGTGCSGRNHRDDNGRQTCVLGAGNNDSTSLVPGLASK